MAARLVLVLLVLVAGLAALLLPGDEPVEAIDAPADLSGAPPARPEPDAEAPAALELTPDTPATPAAEPLRTHPADGSAPAGLSVQALDAAGAPLAGAVVELRRLDARRSSWRLAARDSTNAAGLVPFDADTFARYADARWAAVGPLLRDPPQAAFDPTAPPAAPLELRFPPCGAVVVEVRDAAQAPAPDGATVSLRLAPDQAPAAPDPLADRGTPPAHRPGELRAELVAGRVDFARVELGGELLARVTVAPWSGTTPWSRVLAPQSAGETVVARLDIPASGALQARLLDESGAPLTGRDVTLAFQFRDAAGTRLDARTASVPTDGEGRLSIELPPRDPDGEQFGLVLELAAEPHREARVEGALPPAPEGLDLGDLVVHTQGLVASGRVLTPDGAPHADADVEVRAWFVQQPERGAPWQALRVHTDPDGRYSVHASEAMGRVQLQASAKGFAPSALIELPGPGAERDLQLTRPASISGWVELGADFDASAIQVGLEPHGSTRTSQISWSAGGGRLDAQAAYRFDGLRPGEYVVRLRLADTFSWDNLASTPVITVTEGADVLAPVLDLAQQARTFRLDVVDEHGQPIAEGVGTAAGPRGNNADLSIRDGVCLVQTGHESVHAWLGAPGRRTVSLPALDGDARVVLGPPYRARVRLADQAAVPPGPFRLELGVRSPLGNDNWMLGMLTQVGPSPFDGAGEALIEPTVAGEHYVDVAVVGPRLDDDGRPMRTGVSLEGPARLHVADVDGEQVLVLEVDPGAVADAVEALGT